MKNTSCSITSNSNNCSITVNKKNFDELLQTIVELNIGFDKITSLNISDCKLRDLPDEFSFPNLIEFDISNNSFQNIPQCVLNKNRKLEILNVSYNKLKNFNSKPTFAHTLRTLDLSLNMLETLPIWLFQSCENLMILNLNVNPIDWSVPLRLSKINLKNLHKLSLQNCCLGEKSLMLLNQINSLQTLSLANTEYKHWNSFNQLGYKNEKLIELDLSGLYFSQFPNNLCSLISLQILNLSYNYLSWLPEKLSELKNLRSLNLSNVELLFLPNNFDEFTSLTELKLANNSICSLPTNLSHLKLTYLDCYNNELLIDVLTIIERIPTLKALDLEQNLFECDQSWYKALKETLRNNCEECRGDGLKIQQEEDDDSKSVTYSADDEEEVLQPEIYLKSNDDYPTEDWDEDELCDNYLELPPYTRAHELPIKSNYYHPGDFIDPIYFEDAPNDHT